MRIFVVLFLLIIFSSVAMGAARLDTYLKIHEALASDNFSSALSSHVEFCKNLGKSTYKDCGKKINGIDDLRASFKALSELMIKDTPPKERKGISLAICPMASARWLQKTGPIRNPYYGKSMLECGEEVKK